MRSGHTETHAVEMTFKKIEDLLVKQQNECLRIAEQSRKMKVLHNEMFELFKAIDWELKAAKNISKSIRPLNDIETSINQHILTLNAKKLELLALPLPSAATLEEIEKEIKTSLDQPDKNIAGSTRDIFLVKFNCKRVLIKRTIEVWIKESTSNAQRIKEKMAQCETQISAFQANLKEPKIPPIAAIKSILLPAPSLQDPTKTPDISTSKAINSDEAITTPHVALRKKSK
jgi:hypothetical protein